MAFVAQSATGKNRAVEAAREFMPSEAIHSVEAGSPRALIYTDDVDFRHRTVIFEEKDSIPEEGPAASAIRNLAEKNYLAYDVVEHDPRTGRHRTRSIVRPGPTGLITTSTRSLRNQLGTRHLEVPLSEDPDQTRKVMRSHAEAVLEITTTPPDVAPFNALQRWLFLAGERRVVVPFASVLADFVPATAVRMRRDFRQLLTAIQTVALLRQKQRSPTARGAIIATIADYAIARNLLAGIFDTIVSEGVTPAIRDTVEAIKPPEILSASELAKRLMRSKATVSYRVARALKDGYLVNRETRPGHAARLARGAPLPDQLTALPSPSRVREAFERSRRSADDGSRPSQGRWKGSKKAGRRASQRFTSTEAEVRP